MLSAIVGLAAVGADGVPRWHTPARAMSGGFLPAAYPAGHVNLGLAHGVPGPLALMSLAVTAGVEVPGQRPAIHTTADAVAGAQLLDEWGVTFPIVAAVGDELDAPTRAAMRGATGRPASHGRSGWRASQWVGTTCAASPSRPCSRGSGAPAVRRIESPTLCHGTAGLVVITKRFAADTGRAEFVGMAGDLVGSLVEEFEPGSASGIAIWNLPGAASTTRDCSTGLPESRSPCWRAAAPVEPPGIRCCCCHE